MLARCLFLIAIITSASVAAEVVPFAHDAAPAATIVIPECADDLLVQAAADLRHYVNALCGVELPLRDDGKRVDGTGVYIGPCEPVTDAHLPPEESNPETYAISVGDGDLFLQGRHPPAIAFAVVSFIEEDLGVRWFAPGALWEYVPSGKAGKLEVDVHNRVVTPDWSPRVWSGHGWTASWRSWLLRNKAICKPPVPFRNMQNYLHRVFAPEKYGESHPEYYPLVKGKRYIPTDGGLAWRPCESNPDVIRLTVEASREYLDAHPEHNSFSLAMDDIVYLCGCEQCRAWDASPDDYARRHFTDRHYKFVNAVARELATTHPDKYIGTLCYAIARELPKTVDKLEPNVFISMTQCCAEWWRPGRKEEDMALTREWRKRCDHMSRYDYMGLGFITPRVFPHAMAEGMKFDHALGFEGVYNECYDFLPNTAPMMWMVAKLQWHTERDADALLDEFYDRMFGNAARRMRQYYELLERSWMTPRPGRFSWGHRMLRTQARAMDVADIARADEILGQARDETDDADALRRIDVVAAGLHYGAYAIRTLDLSGRLARVSIDTPEHALGALGDLMELAGLAKEREQYWTAALERDDLVGETLRGLRSKKYFVATQIKEIDARSRMLAALDVLLEHDAADPELERVVRAQPGDLGRLARAWVHARGEALPNLLRNPGFEESGANPLAPKGDWQTADAPPGWSTWSSGARATRFPRRAGEGRAESVASAIAEADSACYLQHVPVEPGQRYLCTVWARKDPARQDAMVRLGVRWQTPGGEWHNRQDLEQTVAFSESVGGWHPLGLVRTVPEGAGRLVFMLSAKYQQAASLAWFDDTALYLLPSD